MIKSSNVKLYIGPFEKVKIDIRPKLTFLDFPDNIGAKYHQYDDNLNDNDYNSLLYKWLYKACNITDGPVFITFNEKHTRVIENAIYDQNILLIQRIYWRFNFGQNQRKKYSPDTRPIYWLNNNIIYPDKIKVPSARQIKYNDKRAKDGGKLPSNVWEFSRICGTFKEKRKFHINQIPEALVKRIILGHSQEEDFVLDGFIGSGTTAYCAYETKRKCIGIDLDPFYIEKIKEEFITRYGVNI